MAFFSEADIAQALQAQLRDLGQATNSDKIMGPDGEQLHFKVLNATRQAQARVLRTACCQP